MIQDNECEQAVKRDVEKDEGLLRVSIRGMALLACVGIDGDSFRA